MRYTHSGSSSSRLNAPRRRSAKRRTPTRSHASTRCDSRMPRSAAPRAMSRARNVAPSPMSATKCPKRHVQTRPQCRTFMRRVKADEFTRDTPRCFHSPAASTRQRTPQKLARCHAACRCGENGAENYAALRCPRRRAAVVGAYEPRATVLMSRAVVAAVMQPLCRTMP